ncbi:PH domain-containing protein [Bacillus albus]|uniref:PH domain-containing protein n=1 Tax=Bacillus TaxID=1386 RepID=UPI001C0F4BC2|nr:MULTISPECIES: PH domain-containing protein [Bacillus]MBU5217966.1 PH domain-containing protein [Bacillus albus]MDA2216195.1 PH domain-containing protein [Bacillus cereus group sp. Bc228]MDA2227540.1 PH domain-containing protein [Bacillus cereus group sp. Bc227]MDA2264186.1 PH domain-containing protein [Bacillus cereus group sp. Bc200]MDA2321886.1 PH domain-containing protein [Bacillus cereus group sp. Bc177]
MDPLKNEIHPDMVKVWKVRAVMEEGIGILVILVYLFLMIKFDWWAWILYVMIGLTVVFAPFSYFLFPQLRQRYYSYQLNEEELEIQHGLFVVKRVLVPMIRVQHVTIEQGPIMRKYGLAELHISTAATSHSIPGLTMYEAEMLKTKIAELAKVSDEDV